LTSIALIAAIKFEFGSFKIHFAELGIFNFPYIWHFNTYVAAILKFFLLLVIVSMMSNEYSYKTLKQNLIDGLSKKEFILSKFYTVIAFALISTIFVFVVSLILGLIYSDYDESSIIFSDMEYLIAFFVKLLGFFSFGLFLGILIKRSAFAVAGMLVWLIGESLFKGFLYWEFYKENVDVSDKVDAIMQFLPMEAMSNLIKEPFSRLGVIRSAANTMGEAFTKSYDVEFLTILIVLFWTFIFIFSSYKLLEKRDL
ncbi:MAG: ABC transporter permease subunit, partial [Polaribacter sp.]|nr:ABC transporter permease subunit [Polaribacter sp.]